MLTFYSLQFFSNNKITFGNSYLIDNQICKGHQKE